MSQLSRQELYDKIKATSKDSYTLSEMKRLGFWSDEKPALAVELIEKKTKLQQEINRISKEITDPKAALKAIHQQRMKAARQRRIETKVKKELKRYQRATDWHQQQQTKITYLGNACHLKQPEAADFKKTNLDLLKKNQLPLCENAEELAQLMGVTLNEIRFLCFTDQVSKRSHYQHFAIAKKTGGTRLISAPMPRLKRLQYWILDHILMPLPITAQAHGFVTGKSIITNATPHIGQHLVINLDLKDFFPTISYPRIKGLFLHQGYNDEIATLLALLCSEPDTEIVEMDGIRYFVHSQQRFLPQGAPTSPMLSNLICRHLDKRLQGLADKYQFKYSRYADDLTFSSAKKHPIKPLLNWIKAIVKEEGFTLHPDKTRIMHQGARQEVTGIVVNQQLSLNRKILKQFRALLFQIKKDGYQNQTWGKGGDLLATITGFAHYVKMVKPAKGQQFLDQIAEIKQLHGHPPNPNYRVSNTQFRQKSAQGELPLPNMSVAQPLPEPDIEDMIEHKEVLDWVKKELGLNENKTIESNQQNKKGLFGLLKSFFGGQS